MGGVISLCQVAASAVVDFMMITVLDYAPNSVRRNILKAEYEGEDLEKRLKVRIGGGWKMFVALYRLNSIRYRPMLSAGDKVPEGIVLSKLADGSSLTLSSLMRPGVPLVVNFGSCS
jgi:hypothetical protein